MKFFYSNILAIVCTAFSLFAQKGEIKGKIIDAQSNAPLNYASVRLFAAQPRKLQSGMLSDDSGVFRFESLEMGEYLVVIDYIGYDSLVTKTIALTTEKSAINLGNLKMAASSKSLDEVTIQAEKSSMELSLDKRVFNVGKDLSNAGGSAVELLTNIPSVSVDPEGTVRLRGSNNVRILIDGKPSGLVSIKGGAGLQNLQGNMIERIEVITNPSARYEAEGMSGIINIILEKDQKQGFNGSFEVIMGQPANYGMAANVNYRHKKINFFINVASTYRVTPSVSSLTQEVYSGDTTLLYNQDRRATLTGINTNIRGGIDYFFNDKSVLTGAYLFSKSKGNRITNFRYDDLVFNRLQSYTLRQQDEDETEPKSQYTLTYKKTFIRKGHELSANVLFLDNWERSDQIFTQNTFSPTGTEITQLAVLQHALNDEFEKQYLAQIDYTQPFGKAGKFEIGVRSNFRDMVNDYLVTQQTTDKQWVPLPGLDNYFIYKEKISAVYGILANKSEHFSYQVGVRAEVTDIVTLLRDTNEENPRKYSTLFPSVHFTYNLPNENGLQLSYSRRVRRPVYDDLSPFMTLADNRNFYSGNPNLNPEFSDVVELGYLKDFSKGSLSSAIYYRNTTDKIERIREVAADGFSRTLPQNLVGEQAIGAEFTTGVSFYKWWKFDMNFNFFHAKIDGSNISELYKTQTTSWFIRQTSRFSLPAGIDLQVRGNYEAPQRTAQGERLALYYFDAAFTKDILKGSGTLNLNVLDVLNSRRMRFITEGINFYSEGKSQFRRRQINLTFSYRIKQTKQQSRKSLNEE